MKEIHLPSKLFYRVVIYSFLSLACISTTVHAVEGAPARGNSDLTTCMKGCTLEASVRQKTHQSPKEFAQIKKSLEACEKQCKEKYK